MNTVESLKQSLAETVNRLDQEGQSLFFVNLGRGLHTLLIAANAEDVRNHLPRPLYSFAYNAYNVTDGLLGHLGMLTNEHLEQNYEDTDTDPLPLVGGLEAEGARRGTPLIDYGCPYGSSPTPRIYDAGSEGAVEENPHHGGR